MITDEQVLFAKFLERAKDYITNDVGMSITTECEHWKDLDNLNLYNVTAIIQGKLAFDGMVLFSAESSLVAHFVANFLGGEATEDDIASMGEDCIGEVLNITLGNTLSKLSSNSNDTTIGAPYVITDKGTLAKSKNGKIIACGFGTTYGKCAFAYLG